MQAQALAGHPVPENYFAQLSAINVSGHVEKKGGFSYLSWPYAVAQLRLADPSATWEVRRFGGLPYLATEAGVFVAVAVTVHGVWGCRWSGCWRTSVWPHSRPFRPASSRAWCAAWRSGVRRFDALAALSRFFQRSAGSVRSRGSRPAPLLTRFIMIVSLPPGTIVALPQGSPEWHCYRQSRRNASESVAVLRLNPWITSYQLWLTKTGRFEPPVTQAMQRGTDLEPVARAAYEEETGLVMQPLVLEAGAYSASLDGMTVEGELIVEIKCRLRGTRSDLWEDVRQGQVPKHYTVQVQHQMMASGAATAHLWVFDGQQGMLHAIGRDAALMERIQNGWEVSAVPGPGHPAAPVRGRYAPAQRRRLAPGRPSVCPVQAEGGRGRSRAGSRPSPVDHPGPASQGTGGGRDRHAVLETGRRGLQTHSRTQDRGSGLVPPQGVGRGPHHGCGLANPLTSAVTSLGKKKTPLSHR